VQIQKTVKEETESLNLPAINEEVHIERIPINKIVEKAPEAVTYEGEIAFTIIICRASLVLK
jgi:stress response protein YsnF